VGHDQAQNGAPKEREEMKEGKKEGSFIHSSTLSSFSLEKVSEYAESYSNDISKCQERSQEIYQRYAVSDDDFYSYLVEAYRLSDESQQMAGVFVRLQILLEGNFKKR
jgi:hypothetical protein